MNQPFTFERQMLDSGLLTEQQAETFLSLTQQLFGSQMGKDWLAYVTLAISPMATSLVANKEGGIDIHQTIAFDAVRSTIGFLGAQINRVPFSTPTP